MAETAKVTISLLTWNGEKYLPWLLKSLKEQTFKDWELLVIDNASSDRSVEIVAEHCPEAKIVRQKINIGFARGHNLLINWSSAPYVLVINQDVILEKDYLAKLYKWLDKYPKVASVSGKLMYWDYGQGQKTQIIDSYGLVVDRQRQVIDDQQGQTDFVLDNQEVFGLSAAATLYSRRALESVAFNFIANHQEFFDEDFFAYKEDIDLAWRLRLAGWQNWLITNTRAYHHRSVRSGADLKAIRKQRVIANKLSYRNHLMMLYKNSYLKNFMHDFWPIVWYEFKKFVYLLLFERSTLSGWSEFFKYLPKLKTKRHFILDHAQLKAEEIIKWFK